jgi:hypothetical protein
METEQTASLDELLGEETTTEEIVVEDAPSGETGETVEATTAEAETETAEPTEEASPASDVTVPMSVVHGERDRRQAAEKERDDLRAKLEASSQTEPTSVFEDESKFRSEIDAQINESMSNVALNQSEFFARREFGSEELDGKIEKFKELVKDNDPLRQRFINATSPYHELVEIVDQHDELAKMEDMDAYRAKIRAEERAAVKKELEDEAAAKAKLRDSVPDSLVDEPSQGGLDSKTTEPLASAEELYN